MAALSLHRLISGKIVSKLFSSLNEINLFLIPLFAATPPAITKVFLFFLLNCSNWLKAILVFLYKISSMVFWKDAAKSNFSCLVLIWFVILRIAVFNPAKDKLQPPLFIIGLGSLNLLELPFFENSSIFGPPGNSNPRSLAVLS